MKGYVDELFSNFSLNSSSEDNLEDSDMYDNYVYPLLVEEDFDELKRELKKLEEVKP
jgi:hypothetical protein